MMAIFMIVSLMVFMMPLAYGQPVSQSLGPVAAKALTNVNPNNTPSLYTVKFEIPARATLNLYYNEGDALPFESIDGRTKYEYTAEVGSTIYVEFVDSNDGGTDFHQVMFHFGNTNEKYVYTGDDHGQGMFQLVLGSSQSIKVVNHGGGDNTPYDITGTVHTITSWKDSDTSAHVDVQPESQTFSGSLQVSIVSHDDSMIYYTTDQTEPDESSNLYTGPFTISSSTDVKAYAVDDYGNTATDQESYLADHQAHVDVQPASKSFKDTLEISIVSDDGSKIYYTTDGSQPTMDSDVYSGSFIITEDTIVKALGVDDIGNMATDEEEYKLDNQAHVDVQPTSQTYKDSLEVSIVSNDGSTIYYTTDGSQPTTESGLYTSPFVITGDITVKAYALDAAGNTATDMETYEVDNQAHVDIQPDAQTYKGSLEVTIVTEDQSIIYYTTDGSEPTTTSQVYTGAFVITVDTTVKALGVDGLGNQARDSEIYKVDNETFVDVTPDSTSFNGSINVSIAAEEGAMVYYTIDETEPNDQSPIYTGPFVVSSTTRVKALAIDALGNKATDEELYTLDDSIPPISISPASKTFVESFEVAITSGGNDIYYSLDGSLPDKNSSQYTGPFQVTETTIVKAIAYNYLDTPSQVVTETYTFVPSVIITDSQETGIEGTNVILRYGYNRTPEEGYKDLFAKVVPDDLPVVGDYVWSISNGDQVIDLVGNRVSYQSVGQAEVQVMVTYLDGQDEKTIEDTILVTVEFYPEPDPIPDPDPTPDPTPDPDPIPEPDPTPDPSVSISLDRDPVELEYGSEALEEFLDYDLTETITGSSDLNVTWSIQDDTIATIDQNGLVTAVKEGETLVTVTHDLSGVTATSTVIVFLVGDEPTPLGLVEFYDPYVFGYPDQTFRPKNDVTRAEVATMFAKILGLNLTSPGQQRFEDVTPDMWYYMYVQAIMRTGIFVGDGTAKFRPDEAITRAEMATVFAKYWQYMRTPVKRDLVTISDVKNDHWASTYIYMMYHAQIVTGYEDGTFRPDDPTLREHVVGMINKLIDRPAYDAPISKFRDISNGHWAFGNIEAASQPFAQQNNIPIEE